jgi:hypothetical protein
MSHSQNRRVSISMGLWGRSYYSNTHFKILKNPAMFRLLNQIYDGGVLSVGKTRRWWCRYIVAWYRLGLSVTGDRKTSRDAEYWSWSLKYWLIMLNFETLNMIYESSCWFMNVWTLIYDSLWSGLRLALSPFHQPDKLTLSLCSLFSSSIHSGYPHLTRSPSALVTDQQLRFYPYTIL